MRRVSRFLSRLSIVFLLIVSIGFVSTLTTQTAAAADPPKPCAVGFGLNFLFCPLIDTTAWFTSTATQILNNLMEFDPQFIAYDGIVYKYWVQFRNIANLVLLFGFMAVIFSQATSIGLSAYGVKKLLPRIMAYAIIINLSFFFCQALVDVSNIIGAGLTKAADQLITGANQGADAPITNREKVWQDAKDLTQPPPDNSQPWEIDKKLSAATSMGVVGLLILPVLLVAFLAALVALAVMVIRIIIIVALVVISPIAIAAAVLPGTKGLFDFWKGTFTSMLAMFPIVGLIFAATDLGAAIILSPTFPLLAGIDPNSDIVKGLKIVVAIIIYVSAFIAIPFTPGMGKGLMGKVTSSGKNLMGKVGKGMTIGAAGAAAGWGAKTAQDRAKQWNMNRENKRLARFGKNPDVGRVRRGWRTATSSAYRKMKREDKAKRFEENASIGKARMNAQNRVNQLGKKRSFGRGPKDPVAAARAQEALDEIESKEAQIKLKFVYKGDAHAAIAAAIGNNDQALINAAGNSMAQNMKLNDLKGHMGSMNKDQFSKLAASLSNNSFSQVKDQDGGFAKALGDASRGQFNDGTSVTSVTSGSDFMTRMNSTANSHYDAEAYKSMSSDALLKQDYEALQRQNRNGVLTTARATRAKTETSRTRGNYKQDRLNGVDAVAAGFVI